MPERLITIARYGNGSAPLEEVEEGLRRRNSPRGTWAEVREILGGMERAGMERFWIQAWGDEPDDVDQALDRLAG